MAELMRGGDLGSRGGSICAFTRTRCGFYWESCQEGIKILYLIDIYFGETSFYVGGEIVLQSLAKLFLLSLTYFS